MRKEDVNTDLTGLAFDFFYWFSRFEYALKENGFLKSHQPGDDAEPSWDAFAKKFSARYTASPQGRTLLDSPPKRQIVKQNDELGWKAIGLEHCRSDLEKVVLLITRVRNNLFHGGKHGGDEWDDPNRTRELLTASKSVLDQLAVLGSIQDDYLRRY